LTYTQNPFVNLSGGNFQLTSNSQPVNQGLVIPGTTDNVTDGRPDIGAYEYGQTPWIPGITWDKTKGASNRCYDLPGEVCGGGVVTPPLPPSPPPPPALPSQIIPGKVEVEVYVEQQGVNVFNRNDGSSRFIGSLGSNDFVDVRIDVKYAGEYELTFNVASASAGGNINLSVDGIAVSNVPVANTGGWREWTQVTSTATLMAGVQILRLEFDRPGTVDVDNLFNVDWINFTPKRDQEQDQDSMMYTIKLKNGRAAVFEL